MLASQPPALTGRCLGQRRTCVRCRPRTGWTAATPRSAPSSAPIGAAASTPASTGCPGASSLCRTQVSRPARTASFLGPRRPCTPRQDPQHRGCPSAESVRGVAPRDVSGRGLSPAVPLLRGLCSFSKPLSGKRCPKSRRHIRTGSRSKNWPGEEWKMLRLGKQGRCWKPHSANKAPSPVTCSWWDT